MKNNKDEDLRQFAVIRNYIIDVVATAVSAGMNNKAPNEDAIARLESQERHILGIIEKR